MGLSLLFALALGASDPSPTAYIVSSRVDPEPILAYRGFGVGNADWQQVFNPTWVEPTPATRNRSGLLVRWVAGACPARSFPTPPSCRKTAQAHSLAQLRRIARSQNCTPPTDAPPGSCGPTCDGTGQKNRKTTGQMASWLTWAELSDDGGAVSLGPDGSTTRPVPSGCPLPRVTQGTPPLHHHYTPTYSTLLLIFTRRMGACVAPKRTGTDE